MNSFASMNKILNDSVDEIEKKVESELLSQLNDFISRGLIVVERSHPSLASSYEDITYPTPNTFKVELNTAVRLVLKDKEYIEKLESENKEFKKALESIASAVLSVGAS